MKPGEYFMALVITIAICFCINTVDNKIRATDKQVEQLQQQAEFLQKQITILQSSSRQVPVKHNRGGERITKQTMTVTAYNADCCGKSPDHPAYGITASGAKVQEWCTVAAGKGIPFGTKIYIPYFADKPNKGVFVVQDRGGMIKDDCIDVYIKNIDQCWEFGRQELEVWILN
jgi:3D (Asp-Asp-Asp) domain-containing protein